MKYGIANTKGGSGGTTIPTINVSQSQWGSNSFTPTQEQLNLMLNNDVIVFKCDYIGKESVMQKVRWDGIYSDDSLTPQTTTIFLSPSILTSDENDNISGVSQLMIVIPQNSQTAYVNGIGTDWAKRTSGVYLVSGTLNEDNGEYYFDYADIDIDESVLKYDDLLIYTSSNNATKIYMVDYIDDENNYVYVVEKASIGGGGKYKHVINITYNYTGVSPIFCRLTMVIDTANSTPFTFDTLCQWLYDNGFYAGSGAGYSASGGFTSYVNNSNVLTIIDGIQRAGSVGSYTIRPWGTGANGSANYCDIYNNLSLTAFVDKVL